VARFPRHPFLLCFVLPFFYVRSACGLFGIATCGDLTRLVTLRRTQVRLRSTRLTSHPHFIDPSMPPSIAAGSRKPTDPAMKKHVRP